MKLKKNSKYNYKIILEITRILKKKKYLDIQYFPSNFSLLSVVKEHENIINIFKKKKHLIFYFSLFPWFYRLFLNEEQKKSLDFFYYNRSIKYENLIEIIPKNIIIASIKNNIISKKNSYYSSNISLVPYKKLIFLRDSFKIYQDRFDPMKSGDFVWMGGDSVMFLRFLENYLKKKSFKRIIEIGSGSGIVIISLSNKSKNCEAIDYNRRAVDYTSLNTKINAIKNLKSYYSNIFNKVRGKFDLIIANPWFVNIKKGGLEEAPYIIKKLDKHLEKKGFLLMLLNSYVKKNKDTAYLYLKKLAFKNNFDISIFVNGYSIERDRLEEYKKYNVNYYVSYSVVIKKDGLGILTKYEATMFRKFRDFLFIKTYKILNFYKF